MLPIRNGRIQKNIRRRNLRRKRNAQNHFRATNNFLQNLEPRCTLASGTFGQMVLVKDARKSYALQIQDKLDILNGNPCTFGEITKSFQFHLDPHPFIVTTKQIVQNDRFFIKIIEQCSRFSLDHFLSMLDRSGQNLPMMNIRLYLSQLSTALDYLHANNYIIKSLNPKSLIVDRLGNICIADLKMLSRIENQEDSRIFFNEEFLAPEVAQGRQVSGFSCDFYALGACAYFMTFLSFPSQKIRPLNLQIEHENFADFLEKSLILEESQRPFQTFENLASHEFFIDVDFCEVLSKQFNTVEFFENLEFHQGQNPDQALDFVLNQGQEDMIQEVDQIRFIDLLEQ